LRSLTPNWNCRELIPAIRQFYATPPRQACSAFPALARQAGNPARTPPPRRPFAPLLAAARLPLPAASAGPDPRHSVSKCARRENAPGKPGTCRRRSIGLALHEEQQFAEGA
jgi:hypothetical protein